MLLIYIMALKYNSVVSQNVQCHIYIYIYIYPSACGKPATVPRFICSFVRFGCRLFPFACWFVRVVCRSFVRPFDCAFRSFVRSCVRSLVRSFMRSFVLAFVRLFDRWFVFLLKTVFLGSPGCSFWWFGVLPITQNPLQIQLEDPRRAPRENFMKNVVSKGFQG